MRRRVPGELWGPAPSRVLDVQEIQRAAAQIREISDSQQKGDPGHIQGTLGSCTSQGAWCSECTPGSHTRTHAHTRTHTHTYTHTHTHTHVMLSVE